MSLASLLIVNSAVVGGFAATFVAFFPHLSFMECVGGAAPLGLTLSAWLALLLKSLFFERCVAAAALALVRHASCAAPVTSLGSAGGGSGRVLPAAVAPERQLRDATTRRCAHTRGDAVTFSAALLAFPAAWCGRCWSCSWR